MTYEDSLRNLRRAIDAVFKRYKWLVNTLNYASKKYYTDDDPIMADEEYDRLYRECKMIEEIIFNEKDTKPRK